MSFKNHFYAGNTGVLDYSFTSERRDTMSSSVSAHQLPFLMHLIDRIHVLHRIQMFRTGNMIGLYPGQPPVPHYIEDHPNCSQREIAEYLQVSTPSIANSVKRMQKAGLLTKHTDPVDLRRCSLQITEKGKRLLHESYIRMEKIDAAAVEGISPAEMEIFCRCLEQIAENLSSEEYKNKNFFSLLATIKELHQQTGEEEST